jgi:HEAT repeat protein
MVMRTADIEALIEALKDKDEDVRRLAKEALDKIQKK